MKRYFVRHFGGIKMLLLLPCFVSRPMGAAGVVPASPLWGGAVGTKDLQHFTYNRFSALLEFVRDYPGEQVPER